jgi:hypothetical protein
VDYHKHGHLHLHVRDRNVAEAFCQAWLGVSGAYVMYLLSVPGMPKSIRDAMAQPLASSAKELNW